MIVRNVVPRGRMHEVTLSAVKRGDVDHEAPDLTIDPNDRQTFLQLEDKTPTGTLTFRTTEKNRWVQGEIFAVYIIPTK